MVFCDWLLSCNIVVSSLFVITTCSLYSQSHGFFFFFLLSLDWLVLRAVCVPLFVLSHGLTMYLKLALNLKPCGLSPLEQWDYKALLAHPTGIVFDLQRCYSLLSHPTPSKAHGLIPVSALSSEALMGNSEHMSFPVCAGTYVQPHSKN